ncbi:MAG: hypothetical protein A3B10_03955 [Candidatus Doudnabacteria bacterium RIFCSPLOWO2_01_FULL_44_21]|uniref:Uncharacterized protein n=1 Tax=Candidatus Doudnabacteria bacterium RIFCSPLOWO2_01_FULL_44_21 TaxID=1817841 RepID=A0A1F5PYB0_9BACT|nr:MAG: hypothetical protein A3B10_03955 [Candidatus Doudnabacteria bacterium RIFCSPLOWO2_01_FULL_44_21]
MKNQIFGRNLTPCQPGGYLRSLAFDSSDEMEQRILNNCNISGAVSMVVPKSGGLVAGIVSGETFPEDFEDRVLIFPPDLPSFEELAEILGPASDDDGGRDGGWDWDFFSE